MNQQEWVNILGDHVRKTENTQRPPYNWPGKPEGTEVVTNYPNMLAELAYDRRWLYYMAEAANVSKEIMASVLEDGEALDSVELYNITKRWNFLEAKRFRCYVAYMGAPVLSMLDSASNKGKWRLRQLEMWMEEAKAKNIELYEWDVAQIQRVIDDMKAGKMIPYAEYRTAASAVAQRLEWRRNEEKKKARVRSSRRKEVSVCVKIARRV